jgi:hypothetical protein
VGKASPTDFDSRAVPKVNAFWIDFAMVSSVFGVPICSSGEPRQIRMQIGPKSDQLQVGNWSFVMSVFCGIIHFSNGISRPTRNGDLVSLLARKLNQ